MNSPCIGLKPVAGITRRQSMKAAALALGSIAVAAKPAWPSSDNGVRHNAAAIHQEATFAASPDKVYEVLTDARQFQQVQLLSGVMKADVLNAKPAQISREAGGAFSLFGEFIVGRQIELVPGRRLVQAWRETPWPDGVYSMVKFELTAQGTGTRLVFDQSGFPAENAAHLAIGWKANYWDAMNKFLNG